MLAELAERMEPERAAAAAGGTRRLSGSSDGTTEEGSSSMLLLHGAPLIAQLPQTGCHWCRRGHVTPARTDARTHARTEDDEESLFLLLGFFSRLEII